MTRRLQLGTSQARTAITPASQVRTATHHPRRHLLGIRPLTRPLTRRLVDRTQAARTQAAQIDSSAASASLLTEQFL